MQWKVMSVLAHAVISVIVFTSILDLMFHIFYDFQIIGLFSKEFWFLAALILVMQSVALYAENQEI